MELNKKLVVIILSIAISISVSASFSSLGSSVPHYENLKVLPKNISSKELQSIMVDDFEDGLGVTCGFCHASKKDGHGLDFASDAKPEKEIARSMMRMTMGINQKYFKLKHPKIGNPELTVTCNTCHKGVAFPDGSN
jgi:hypothetical protein